MDFHIQHCPGDIPLTYQLVFPHFQRVSPDYNSWEINSLKRHPSLRSRATGHTAALPRALHHKASNCKHRSIRPSRCYTQAPSPRSGAARHVGGLGRVVVGSDSWGRGGRWWRRGVAEAARAGRKGYMRRRQIPCDFKLAPGTWAHTHQTQRSMSRLDDFCCSVFRRPSHVWCMKARVKPPQQSR